MRNSQIHPVGPVIATYIDSLHNVTTGSKVLSTKWRLLRPRLEGPNKDIPRTPRLYQEWLLHRLRAPHSESLTPDESSDWGRPYVLASNGWS
jgi:hypothetical protein